MRQVIVFPRGQLASKDRERLTKAGMVVVEADDPSRVVTVIPASTLMSADDLVLACLTVLRTAQYGGDVLRSSFAKDLADRIAKRNET